MSCSLYLSIGDYFTELTVRQGLERSHQRWSTNLDGLEKRLGQTLNALGCGAVEHVYVDTPRGLNAIDNRLGSTPAVIMTSGFENWLDINIPHSPSHFSIYPSREKPLWDPSLCFGVNERISADGKILKALDTAELEFLVTKLQMHKVDTITVCLLHSIANNTHEKLIQEYFQEKGFKVFCSHLTSSHPFEISRWLSCLLAAYIFSNMRFIDESIQKAIADKWDTEHKQIQFLTNEGPLWTTSQPEKILSTLFGTSQLLRLFAVQKSKTWQRCIYAGLERFVEIDNSHADLWESPMGPVAIKGIQLKNLNLQPTQLLGVGFWGVPKLQSTEAGYEPGPMCLGKGVSPTFLDLISIEGRLDQIEGLKEKLSEKAAPRIAESLRTLTRHIHDFTTAQDLARQILFRARRTYGSQSSADTVVFGPLAHVFTDAKGEEDIRLSSLLENYISQTVGGNS